MSALTNTALLYYCYGMVSSYVKFGYIPKECVEKFKQMDAEVAAQEKKPPVERPINYEEGA